MLMLLPKEYAPFAWPEAARHAAAAYLDIGWSSARAGLAVWHAVWLAPIEGLSETSRTAEKRSQTTADQSSTFSAYRSSGGHAVAQIIELPVGASRQPD